MKTFTYSWFEHCKEGVIRIAEEGENSYEGVYICLSSMEEALELKKLARIAAADFDRVKKYK
jgi:hypothetical protein